MTEYPWVAVSGFGAHIKSTQRHLIIQKKNTTDHYPLDSLSHLMIVGGHHINSATITKLIKLGVYITFFDPDGTPVGTIRPVISADGEEIDQRQDTLPRQRYAIAIAAASIKSRLFAIERIQQSHGISLFYEGELDVLMNSLDELEYLIKMDEIKRLHKLTSDMYYEILSRHMPPDWGYRRRSVGPQADPVNAMLSFGYALLYGNCNVAVIGAHLNPDMGLLHDGKGSLVQDLIDPLKATLVDPIVIQVSRELLAPSDFEVTPDRCLLSDPVIKNLISSFYTKAMGEKVNEQVYHFSSALKDLREFPVLY